MSNIKPMTKMKKFIELQDSTVDTLHNELRNCWYFTDIRPHKNSLIHIGMPPEGDIDRMTFNLELEYKGVLMLCYYNPTELDKEMLEYTFAYEWTDESIESGSDEFLIKHDIEGGEFFQQSLMDDMHFLTFELHQELVKYIQDVKEKLRIKIESTI